MIDFHTHILPDIDDGSSTVEESVKMIEMLCEQGVKKIILTPHFYAYVSSVDGFVANQRKALEKLLRALEETKPDVELYIGGEVLFFEELWRVSEIKDFCIKGTNYMLLEMPFSSWDKSMVENVVNLCSRGVVPILAHYERYLKYKGNLSKIKEMVNAGVLLQMNCDFLHKFFSRSKAVKAIRKGAVFALGSDCHNLSGRKPNFDNVECLLKKKLGKRQYGKFVGMQEMLIKNAVKVYPSV